MFRKLVSGLPFSPALVGTLGFYARRLKQEEATRRLGLIFTALALVVQSFAVFSPPEHANAASSNDMMYGGISSKDELLKAYDTNASFQNVMKYAGITRENLANTQLKTINNLSYGTGSGAWKSWGYGSRFSSAQGEVKHSAFGTTVYSRPNYLFNNTASEIANGSNVQMFHGSAGGIGEFGIMLVCGNLISPNLPTPPPPPPAPVASCSNLSITKYGDNRVRFKVTSSVSGGATISSYTITVKDANGAVVKTITQPSTSTTLDLPTEYTFSPGSYTVDASVTTSLGTKTSTGCTKSFTIAQPPAPTNPAIHVDKKVDGVEQKTVQVNQEFAYQIVVKNTGDVPLGNVVVTDTAPQGVTLVRASSGTINGSKWTQTLGSLNVGQSTTITLTAKAPQYVGGLLKNTVCVDTSTISGTPDDCDDAVVQLPVPEISVCQLATFKVVTIKQTDFNPTAYSKDLADCKRIQVCNLASNTNITIREKDFNASTHSKDASQCENIQVCDLVSGEIKTIVRNDYDQNKHSKEAYDCQSSVVLQKTVTNLTQNSDASKVLAQSGDRIQITLTAENAGKVTSVVDFKDNITDSLQYATVHDNGGGALTDERNEKTLSWGNITLGAGEKVSRTFTLRVVDEIPATPQGLSDPSSYDCVMTNTFGNATTVAVACEAPKLLETTIRQLPSTGPGENMLFAGVLGSVVTFFYARSRQLVAEVRLIRKDFNSGTL